MNDSSVLRLLLATPPFSAVPRAELARLEGTLRLGRFADGQTLFNEGDPATEGWLVRTGTVRVLAFSRGSRLMQVERLGPGELAGVYCRLGRRVELQQCTAVAEGPVEALRVPDEVFDRYMAKFEAFSREACRGCAVRLGSMRRLALSAQDTVERRVAGVLARLEAAQGPRVKATRQRLAVDAGTAVETVFRVLARFRRSGWLETERGVVVIHDPAALRRVASGSP